MLGPGHRPVEYVVIVVVVVAVVIVTITTTIYVKNLPVYNCV